MPKQRRPKQRKQEEILDRTIRVQSVGMSVWVRAVKPRRSYVEVEDHPSIEVRGRSVEALDGVHRFHLDVFSGEPEEPTETRTLCVGAIFQVKPRVYGEVRLDNASFDRVWALAASKQLRYCRLAFTRPSRRSALIVSITFSNELEE